MPTLTIDGQEVTVDRGTTILQAAQQLGIEIPTFCYHPGLSAPANCRMCLVVMDGAPNRPPPKPVPACYTQVNDGMSVHTNNERVKGIRQHVLEFILLNHPIDCPVCDQAGECVLQDHYVKYSARPSRQFLRKVHKPKAKVLGPDVMLDAERCIVCTRCVRFMDEIAKDSQLEVLNRGDHSEISTFPGRQLDNPYAGNVVDICPVGALTSREFRFHTRVWFLQTADGVCTECSRNCRVRVDSYENTVRRIKPLENRQVNDWWMCDEGRRSFKRYLDDRAAGPMGPGEGGARKPTPLAQAVDAAASALQGAGPKRTAVVVSPWLSNEDAFLVGKLLSGPLNGAKIYMGGRADGEGDDILRRADKNPNRAGVEAVFKGLGVTAQPLSQADFKGLGAALVFGDQHVLTDAQRQALSGLGARVIVGTQRGALWELATVFLPARTPFEKDATYTNFEGVVQRAARAVVAAKTCKSDGWYAMKLGQKLGAELALPSAAAVFAALSGEVEPFKGMRFDGLGPAGVKLGEGAPAPTAEPVAPQPTAAQVEA